MTIYGDANSYSLLLIVLNSMLRYVYLSLYLEFIKKASLELCGRWEI